jgi:hypothetical protein
MTGLLEASEENLDIRYGVIMGLPIYGDGSTIPLKGPVATDLCSSIY